MGVALCVQVIAGTMKRIQIALLFVVSALTAVTLSVRAQGSDDLCTFCIDIVTSIEEWLKQGKTQDEIAALVEKVSGINLHPIVNISKLYYLHLFRSVQPWFYPC